MEALVAADPSVMTTVMFGRERNQVGILVEPVPNRAFDPSDSEVLAGYRNEIW
jgi:hypothetical protein